MEERCNGISRWLVPGIPLKYQFYRSNPAMVLMITAALLGMEK